jgi:hypothetical protein
MTMIINRKKKVAISAAIAVPIAVFLVIAAMPSTITYKSAQFGDTSLEFSVSTAEKVFTGRVVSVEVKQIDQFVEIPDNPEASFLRQDLYQFVTVEVTKYLKDETGENPEQVTFYDDVTGCFDWLEKRCQVHEHAIEYETGEKALFILERIDDPANGPLDGLLTTTGFVETHKIVDDKAPSAFGNEDGKEPKNLAGLEKQIKEIDEKA